MGIATLLPMTALLPWLDPSFKAALPLYLVAISGILASFIFLHRGYVNLAAGVMCALGWLVTMWTSFAVDGLASPQLSMGVLAIMLAGILLSGWGALVMAVTIALSLVGIEVLRDASLLPAPYLEGSRVTVWAALSSVLILSAVLLQLYVNAMRTAREEAANTAQQLATEMERRLLTEASLRRAEKLEALGRLSGGIAHDFNNILTVLQGESDLLNLSAEQGRQFSKTEQDNLQEIRRSTEKAAALTSQLLAFSRQQPGSPEHVDIDLALSKMQSMLKRLIRANVELCVSADSGNATVRIDPSQLDQVIMNLALNASDAMPNGGRLSISTCRATLNSRRFVCIEVTDTGEGISPDEIELIFDPFFTTKGFGQGTGLGLASTHGIVSAAEGEIDVSSAIGSGTTVKIYLPIYDAAIKTTQNRVHVDEPGTPLRILLCEDDPEVRSVTQRILASAGHSVTALESAEATLEWMQQNTEHIDLLVTDVILPGENGVQLARHVSSTHPHVRVLLISGYTADVLQDTGLPSDMELLHKPFTNEGLLQRVGAITSIAA